MSISTALAAVAALGAGTVGAFTAYQVVAPEPAAPQPTAVDVEAQTPRSEGPGFTPCRPPSELRGRRCVTTVTRTVVVPSPATPAPTRTADPTSAARTTVPDGRHHGRHSGDDDGGRVRGP